MSQYTLSVKIDRLILNQQSSDKLVIARKVNGSLNAVFDGYSIAANTEWKQLFGNNTFQWTEKFKVFLQNNIQEGASVNSQTNDPEIESGELGTYNANQIQNPVKQAPGFFKKPGSFAVDKVPSNLHVGVKMSTAGGSWSTIYVDRDQHVGVTKIQLQPQNEYLLMWKNEITTEAIWALAETDGKLIVFKDGELKKEVRYGFATADKPINGEEPSWY